MITIKFNSLLFAVLSDEQDAIILALNLHKNSNVKHNIIVTKDDIDIVLLSYVPNESV